MKTHAVDLHGEQDGDSKLVEVSGCSERGSAAQTLSEQDDAGMGTFFGIEVAVLIGVEGAADEFKRDGTMPVGERFGVDVGSFSELERELADASVVVVPVFKSAEKSNDKRGSWRNRRWR